MSQIQATSTISTPVDKPAKKAADQSSETGFSELLGHQVGHLSEEERPQQEPPASETDVSGSETDIPEHLILSKLTVRSKIITEEGVLSGDAPTEEIEPANEELAMSMLNSAAEGLGDVKRNLASKKSETSSEQQANDALAKKIFEHPEQLPIVPPETDETPIEDAVAASAVIVPFGPAVDAAATAMPTAEGKQKPKGVAPSGATETPAVESALSWDRLTQYTVPQDEASNVIPLMQAAAERVLNPLNRREATPEELVLAVLGERDGVNPGQAARPAAAALPEGIVQLDTINDRIMRVEQLSSRFGEQVLSMVQQNEKVMKITVQPAALGQLTVLVREENQRMTVEIHSQSEAVRELITRQEDSIRRLMQENNVELGKFDVLLKDQSKDPREQLAEGQRGGQNPTRGIGPASNEGGEPKDSPAIVNGNAASWVA